MSVAPPNVAAGRRSPATVTGRLAQPEHARRARAGSVRRWRVGACGLLLAILVPAILFAAETIPPAPPNHFNDYAGVVPPATAQQLDAELTQFERDTSNQIVVAVYPTMQSDSSIDDYAVRLFQAWHVGQQHRNNGVLLLVFTQSHRMRIQTGYGLEGALPDALCARIMDNEMAPHFHSGDYAGGLTAGIHAIMAATKGEYTGTGRVANETPSGSNHNIVPVIFVVVIILFSLTSRRRRRAAVYGRRGMRWMGPTWWGGGWGGGGGGGSWGGGGGGFGSGGSFSGGGGSTGGGGASGSW